ncbi:hypothetical protein EAH68_13385 [Corynebacterium hylobatis]|uniref:Antitoxin VbhA domain-containing protein n=1 Tax=Corynebacterium hylobatis TaxID=1859290 RepID=A0A3R9ZCV9_9CORY|nr:hypothetical protein EAH68_13385 [Corynebacterium hylobatis]
MATSRTPATSRSEREWHVAQAIHNGEMEGLHVTPAGRKDAEQYIDGQISSDELVARARARFGLV